MFPNNDDKDGAKQVAMGNPDYFAWQKDIAISTRIDLTDNWLVKLECHSIDGTAHVLRFFNEGTRQQNWSLFSMMSTFHF